MINDFYQADQKNKLGLSVHFGYVALGGSAFLSFPYCVEPALTRAFLCRQQASWFAHRTNPNAG